MSECSTDEKLTKMELKAWKKYSAGETPLQHMITKFGREGPYTEKEILIAVSDLIRKKGHSFRVCSQYSDEKLLFWYMFSNLMIRNGIHGKSDVAAERYKIAKRRK
jgi:hypothetical protein